ncbi:hypothetical protein QBC46DRAFT_429320 [Diplogelasinospora grovesii]|uniref:Zn(2)-C6 fungal-type domain-containing protein n=1 Tax=Diplogelasinospora grovesii TaxID=303347 RepID=A0AAN6MWC0_9PEZI|nr:hypothetical protein QBC46DRAFT_429320 [Diplogelasinospora grovesii]
MSTASSSPAPSPRQSGPKSDRVCRNCRDGKKGCDKVLPVCSRCRKSGRVCVWQDDGDLLPRSASSASGSVRFESFMLGQQQVLPGTPSYSVTADPLSGYMASATPTLNPSMFASMDSATEDIHSFTLRCLVDILNHRQSVEHVVSQYFEGVNTWFTIVERATFERQLEDMWLSPSAETAALVLCMLLIVRTPNPNSVFGMGDGRYLSTKTILGLVRSKVPLSMPLMQAELLVAMYEFSHGMPQQAYMSVGTCYQMSRAFGWHSQVFWSEEHQRLRPDVLKLSSILWWAIVYVDCLVQVGYQEQKYPLHTSDVTSSFTVPFPEVFDQYLPDSLGFGLQSPGQNYPSGVVLDANMDQIDGMVWPEASSAWYLSNVLQELSSGRSELGPYPPPPTAQRNVLSGAITAHTLDLYAGNWKDGDRIAAVGTNFIALMKLNQPCLLHSVHAPSSMHQDDSQYGINTIKSAIDAVQGEAVKVLQVSDLRLSKGGVAPCLAFTMYYASLLLISHGEGGLQYLNWLEKVEEMRKALQVLSGRWKIAEKYLNGLNIALNNRFGGYAT